MTLVVGRILDGAVRIVADSQITYGIETPFQTPFRGTLKMLAISSQTAVAYSSSHVDLAMKAIRQAIVGLGKPSHTVTARELALSLRSDTASLDHEFLVASQTIFHLVRAGDVELDQQAAWIGDHSAFSEFQRLFLEGRSELPADLEAKLAEQRAAMGFTADDAARSKMSDALNTVAGDPRFPSVGGLSVTLAADSIRRDGFRYLPYTCGFDFNPVFGGGPPQSVLRSRSVEEGGYNYSLLVPAQPGVAAIAVHVLQGRRGVLFRPLTQDEPAVIDNVTALEFMAAVASTHGIELTGMPWC